MPRAKCGKSTERTVDFYLTECTILLISSCSPGDTVISPSFPGRHSAKSTPRENIDLAVSLTPRGTARI